MKVIHLISGGDTGGAKTHLHYLLSGICSKIDATLVCFMNGEFSEEAKEKGIPTIVMEGSNYPATVRRLKRMIIEGGYDIIHSHGSKGNFIASLVKNACGLPMVTTIHSDYKLDYLGRPAAALVYGTLNSLALKRADYYIGVSDSMRQLLIERGFAPNDIFSIYNGVDFSIVPKNNDKVGYLRSLGLDCDENSIVVGAAARLDPVKDIATLVRGFASAHNTCPHLRLIVAGDGGELENLKKLSAELGVESKVCFAGWRSDINDFYAALDINALTSLSETFPYAITEGARAHLPTISSRVGGVPMLVEEGETGFLFPAGDWQTLGDKLTRLASDPGLRARMGQAIYDRARQRFSVDATTDRQLEIYSEILRREELKKRKGSDGVVICGAYGMGNAGDDAILEAIVGEMRSIDPFMPITALSRRPKETKRLYGINSLHMFNYPGFRRVMKGTRLYLSGGGSLIQDVTSRRSLWYYLTTIRTAKQQGNRVMMYGCGIGPIVDKRDESKVRDTLNSCVDVITLREEYSRDELIRLGVTAPTLAVTSDPALSLPGAAADRVDACLRENGMSVDGRYICFCVRSWTGFELKCGEFSAAADFAYRELGLQPVFVLINRMEDGASTDAVCAGMKSPSVVLREPMDTALTIGVLSRMAVVVSMRLHGLIFAASQGVPLVGVSYDPKVTAFLDSVGEDNCIPLESMTASRLKPMMDRAARLSGDKEAKRQTIDKLTSAEVLNSRMARELLEK